MKNRILVATLARAWAIDSKLSHGLATMATGKWQNNGGRTMKNRIQI